MISRYFIVQIKKICCLTNVDVVQENPHFVSFENDYNHIKNMIQLSETDELYFTSFSKDLAKTIKKIKEQWLQSALVNYSKTVCFFGTVHEVQVLRINTPQGNKLISRNDVAALLNSHAKVAAIRKGIETRSVDEYQDLELAKVVRSSEQQRAQSEEIKKRQQVDHVENLKKRNAEYDEMKRQKRNAYADYDEMKRRKDELEKLNVGGKVSSASAKTSTKPAWALPKLEYEEELKRRKDELEKLNVGGNVSSASAKTSTKPASALTKNTTNGRSDTSQLSVVVQSAASSKLNDIDEDNDSQEISKKMDQPTSDDDEAIFECGGGGEENADQDGDDGGSENDEEEGEEDDEDNRSENDEDSHNEGDHSVDHQQIEDEQPPPDWFMHMSIDAVQEYFFRLRQEGGVGANADAVIMSKLREMIDGLSHIPDKKQRKKQRKVADHALDTIFFSIVEDDVVSQLVQDLNRESNLVAFWNLKRRVHGANDKEVVEFSGFVKFFGELKKRIMKRLSFKPSTRVVSERIEGTSLVVHRTVKVSLEKSQSYANNLLSRRLNTTIHKICQRLPKLYSSLNRAVGSGALVESKFNEAEFINLKSNRSTMCPIGMNLFKN
jgi:hypothetical protein